MSELTTLIIICLADWGIACQHMAFVDDYRWKTIYAIPLPIFGDVWHLVGGARYLAFTALAWEVYVHWWMYPLTALINYAGWQVGKRIHNKDWPPIWRRWF